MQKSLHVFLIVLLASGIAFSGLLPVKGLSVNSDSETGESSGNSSQKVAELQSAGFEPIATDNTLQLYLNRENGEISVLDDSDGSVWNSSPADKKEESVAKGTFKMSLYSLLTLTVIDSKSNSSTGSTLTSYTECVLTDGGVSYQMIKGGFSANYFFVDEGITVPITVKLEKGALCISVDTKRITETTSTWIQSISLLPYFGAANRTQKGYLFVPDGSGALIYFNNGKTFASAYEEEIYGQDLADVPKVNRYVKQQNYLPVFGLQNEQGGFLAVVDGAAANAKVHAEVAEKTTCYNAVSAKFTLRNSSVVNIGDNQVIDYEKNIKDVGTLSAKYYFYSGDGGYTKMASIYRQCLEEKYKIPAKTDRSLVHLQFLNSYPETGSFLGFDYLKQRPLTTYDETLEILNSLKDQSVDAVSVSLTNWDSGSKNGTITRNPQYAAVLGGKKQFNNLVQYTKNENIPVYLSTRVTAYKKNGLFSGGAARTIENINIEINDYALSTYRKNTSQKPYYLLSPEKLEKKIDSLISGFSKNELTHLDMTDLSTKVYSDYGKNAPSTKTKSVEYFDAALKKLKDGKMSLISEGANAYAIPYLDEVVNAPMSSSNYDIEDASVPFYQLVLNGILNYTTPALNLSSDLNDMFLFALESGSSLCYLLSYEDSSTLQGSFSKYYSIESHLWMKDIVEKYAALSDIYDKTNGMLIASHTLIAEKVSLVEFKNGSAILVNRSDKDIQTEYGTIKAGSYLFIEERGK